MVTLTKSTPKQAIPAKPGWATAAGFPRQSLRIAAIGAVDETNSAIGIARLDAEGDRRRHAGAHPERPVRSGRRSLRPEDGRKAEGRLRIAAAQVERLEREIDAMNESSRR